MSKSEIYIHVRMGPCVPRTVNAGGLCHRVIAGFNHDHGHVCLEPYDFTYRLLHHCRRAHLSVHAVRLGDATTILPASTTFLRH